MFEPVYLFSLKPRYEPSELSFLVYASNPVLLSEKFKLNEPSVRDIIEKRVNNEIENNKEYDNLFGDDKTSSYLNKIIHYDVSRLVLDNYFNEKDISNLYNTIVSGRILLAR